MTAPQQHARPFSVPQVAERWGCSEGLVPFLRVCRAMNIEPCSFLTNLPELTKDDSHG